MIIKSQFTDYYDYVAHAYGGGDPKIVYLRHRLRPMMFNGWSHRAEPVYVEHLPKRNLRMLDVDRELGVYKYVYLCVCGKYYLCVIENDNVSILDPTKHPERYARLCTRKLKDLEAIDNIYKHFVGEYDPDLVELSRKVGAPVFIIEGTSWNYDTGKTRLVISPEIPKLGDLGLAALYKPEQLYQDISYFICNLLQDSPDLATPVVLADKDRIVQHGFDLKQSFRHRK